MGEPLKLHVGCGKRYLPGWKHVDVLDFDHIDYKTTLDDLHMIEDGSVEEIYACHVLEHIDRRKVISTVQELNRVLRVGGKLRLAVPDFEAVVGYYNENPGSISQLLGLLVGGQTTEYDHHTFVFDKKILTEVLEYCGFENVERYDWQKFLPEGFDDYSRCYLPHMDFENGRCMSLNIVAVKRTTELSSSMSKSLSQATCTPIPQ